MYKYKCDICGRPLKKKCSLQGYTLCSKHMHQLLKHGKFLDTIQRTNNDLNDYIIIDDIAIFNLYNQKNIKIGEFLIDSDDIDKVKYHKWRISHNHVITGTKGRNNIRDLSWIILDIEDIQDNVVDHINNNPFDNRKINLRLCKQSENTKNLSLKSNNSSGFAGVSYIKKRNKWNSEIKINYKKIHLGEYKEKKEAVYARLVGELFFFDTYKNANEFIKKRDFTSKIPFSRKVEIFYRIKDKYLSYSEKAY